MSSETKQITWIINRKSIANVPTPKGDVYYSGAQESPEWNNFNSDTLIVTGNTGTEIGEYEAVFTPTSNYCWSDGSIEPKKVKWNIVRAVINTVPSQSGTLRYTGGTLTPTWNNYDSNKLSISGTTSNSAVGTYKVQFTPKGTYVWSDGTQTSKEVQWTIQKGLIANIPSQSGTLTYNANNQSPSWSNYNTSQLTIGGTTTSKNAGTYNATFTPTSNYTWSDGSTNSKTVSWVIGRKTFNIPSVSNTSKTYNTQSQSPSISSYDTNYINISGNTGTNAGNYTVTFSLKDTTNYQWSNGQTSNQTANWVINKATGTLAFIAMNHYPANNVSATYGSEGSQFKLVFTPKDVNNQNLTISVSNSTYLKVNASNNTIINDSGSIYNGCTARIITVSALDCKEPNQTITFKLNATDNFNEYTATLNVTLYKADSSSYSLVSFGNFPASEFSLSAADSGWNKIAYYTLQTGNLSNPPQGDYRSFILPQVTINCNGFGKSSGKLKVNNFDVTTHSVVSEVSSQNQSDVFQFYALNGAVDISADDTDSKYNPPRNKELYGYILPSVHIHAYHIQYTSYSDNVKRPSFYTDFNSFVNNGSVGDFYTCKLNNYAFGNWKDLCLIIIGSNHNSGNEGANRHHIMALAWWGAGRDIIPMIRTNWHSVNSYNEDRTWKDSDLRSRLNNEFYNLLPTEVKNRIVTCKKSTFSVHSNTENIETEDKIFIPDYYELTGRSAWSSNETTGRVPYNLLTRSVAKLDIISLIKERGISVWCRTGHPYNLNGAFSLNWCLASSIDNNGNFVLTDTTSQIGVLPCFAVN